MTEQQHPEYLLSHPSRRRWSIGGFLFTLVCLVPVLLLVARIGPEVAVMYGVKLPLAATPYVTFSTPQDGPGTPRRPDPPPSTLPRYTPFYAAPAASGGGDQETPTTAPTVAPAPTSFWTEEELKAWTATAEAWYDPATIPTAPPAFVQYVDEKCKDQELVADSPTLQLFCRK